jgi:4-amino-4-deoxychorismate lyase
VVQNTKYHEERFRKSFKKFYSLEPSYGLFDTIDLSKSSKKGREKLRISYNMSGSKYSLEPYEKKSIQRLKIVFDDSIDYDLKFENRANLNMLFQQKMYCDDILIVKNGMVTDTSYANIVLLDGANWYTSKFDLLNGTKKSQLLENGAIRECGPIKLKDLEKFKGFQLINAMLDFKPESFLPIKNIIS